MEERAIHISSINRKQRGKSRPGDFTIKFNPSLKLDPEMKHQLALLQMECIPTQILMIIFINI